MTYCSTNLASTYKNWRQCGRVNPEPCRARLPLSSWWIFVCISNFICRGLEECTIHSVIINMIYYPSTGHIMWGLRWVRHFCISWFSAMCIQAKHSDLCIGIALKIYSLMSDSCLSNIIVPKADWRGLCASPRSSLGCWWLGIHRWFSHLWEMRYPFSALQGP